MAIDRVLAACLTAKVCCSCSFLRRVAVVSTEAALVMTKAAEHFIGWMTCKAMANKDTKDRKKACLDYQDLTPLLGQHPEQLEFATDLYAPVSTWPRTLRPTRV